MKPVVRTPVQRGPLADLKRRLVEAEKILDPYERNKAKRKIKNEALKKGKEHHEFADSITLPGDGFGWIRDQKKIWSKLDETKFLEFHTEIRKHAMPYDTEHYTFVRKSQDNTFKLVAPEDLKESDLVPVVLNFDVKTVAERLGASKMTIYRYIDASKEFGVLIPLLGRLAKGKRLYIAGYWDKFKSDEDDRSRLVKRWFLRESTRIKAGLRKIRFRRGFTRITKNAEP